MIQFVNRYSEVIGGTAGIMSIFGIAMFVVGCDTGNDLMIWCSGASVLLSLYLYIHTSMVVDERKEIK